MNLAGFTMSKKLAVVLIALLVLVLDSQGLLGLDPADVTTLKWVVVSYILGQSMVDAYSAPARKQAPPEDPPPPPPPPAPSPLLSPPSRPETRKHDELIDVD